MDFLHAIQTNFLSPPVLFFALGVFATLVRSDLKFPEPFYTALTIYLLTAIGFKGGGALAEAGWAAVWKPGLAAIALGTCIPLWTYPLLRRLGKMSPADAAALCAHYGSVSAVTFIAATNFLNDSGIPYENYASAFLAVMESPAIIVGIVLGKLLAPGRAKGSFLTTLRPVLHEAMLGRGVVLLVGALVVGYLSGSRGAAATAGFFVTPFQGVLALFLLEMGMVAARRFADLRRVGFFLIGFGVLMPVVHGAVGAWLGWISGLSEGGTLLMAVLAASASYIAAPAAIRLSIPDANPTLYLTAALAITFPFNITIGLPLYFEMARWLHAP